LNITTLPYYINYLLSLTFEWRKKWFRKWVAFFYRMYYWKDDKCLDPEIITLIT